MPPIVAIVGTSGSGKTTLIEKLIPEFIRRGRRVGTIKHTSHAVDADKKGKDSWRHKAAGAEAVILASRNGIAMFKTGNFESLDALTPYFGDVDIVIAEGYKMERRSNKIEVVRKAAGKPPIFMTDDAVIAVVTDMEAAARVPIFGLEEIEKLADFIEDRCLTGGDAAGAA